MKINAKHSNLLFAFFMSVLMALLMSGVLTAIHLGFVTQWLHSFVLAWPIAFPSILLIAPIVRKIVTKITT
jgi:Protein of unknown function (DUF2798)